MVRGRDFRTVVFHAAASGNLARIKIFVEPNKNCKKWIDQCLNDDFNPQFPLVIAAKKGHLEIVEYLTSVGADPSVRGTVEFDNDDINDTPALWAAAAAGHFEVVKFLVEVAKADINQTTRTQSTPLRGACYDGHLEIVKYLLEHGADINIPNRHGHTSLMIAAYRNKIDVVKHLISKNADINFRSTKGNTALHDASESGNTEIVQLLVDAGAVMSRDFQNVCPLLCAAQSGHPEVVEILLTQIESNILRRDAYKLLGCTFVDKKMDNRLALSYWAKSLNVELSREEWQTIYEWNLYTEPLEVYDNSVEVQHISELDELSRNINAIQMQSLVIRERILGGAHTDVHYYLRFRGAVFCDFGNMEKCYELWKHALDLQQKYFTPLNLGTVTTIQSFQETFGIALNDYVNSQHVERSLRVSPRWVVYVFERACQELERVYAWTGSTPLLENDCCFDEPCRHTSEEKEMKKLVVTALQLINLLERLSLPSVNIENEQKITELNVGRLVRLCHCMRIPILHYSLEELAAETGDYMALPKASVLEKILEHRIDTTFVDEDGNSPLHVLLKSTTLRKSMVRMLLDNGAYLFARNRENVVVYDALMEIMNQENSRDISIGKYISLMELAANAIQKNSTILKYEEGQVPSELITFIKKH